MKSINMKQATSRLGMLKGIEGLPARRGGTAINQAVINFENGQVFQSYNTIIGVKMGDNVWLSNWYDCSKTTMFYLKQWLGVYVNYRQS